MTKLDCGVCGRMIGRRRHGAFYPHLYLGDVPSVWLRSGEACPGSGAFQFGIRIQKFPGQSIYPTPTGSV